MLSQEENVLLKFCLKIRQDRATIMNQLEKKELMDSIFGQWINNNPVGINTFFQAEFDFQKLENIKEHIREVFVEKKWPVQNLGNIFYRYAYGGNQPGIEQMELGNAYESIGGIQKFLINAGYGSVTPLYSLYKEFDMKTLHDYVLPNSEINQELRDNLYDRLIIDKDHNPVPAFNWLNLNEAELKNVSNSSHYEYSICPDVSIIADYVEKKLSEDENYKDNIDTRKTKTEFISVCVEKGEIVYPLLGKHIIQHCSFEQIKTLTGNMIHYRKYLEPYYIPLLSKLKLLTALEESRWEDLKTIFEPLKNIKVFNKTLINIISSKSFYAKDAWKVDDLCVNYLKNVFSVIGENETKKLIEGISVLSHNFCEKTNDITKIAKLHEEEIVFMYLLNQKMVFSMSLLLKEGYVPHLLEIDRITKSRKINKIIENDFPELFNKNVMAFEDELKIILSMNSKANLKKLEEFCFANKEQVLSTLYQGKEKDIFLDYYAGSKVDKIQYSTVSIVPKLIGDKQLDKLCVFIKNGLELNEKESALLYLVLDANPFASREIYEENMSTLFTYIKSLPILHKKELFRNMAKEKFSFIKMNNEMSESLMNESIELIRTLTKEVMPVLSGREKQEILIDFGFNSVVVFLLNDSMTKKDKDLFLYLSNQRNSIQYAMIFIEKGMNICAKNFDSLLIKEFYVLIASHLQENKNSDLLRECKTIIEKSGIESNKKEELVSSLEKIELHYEFDKMKITNHSVKNRL